MGGAFRTKEERTLDEIAVPPEISGITTITGNHQIIYDQLKKAASRRKGAQGQFYRGVYRVGDKVLVKSPHSSSSEQKLFRKFFPIFEGPYVIEKVLDNNSVVLSNQGHDCGVQNWFNIKPYKEMVER